MARRTRAKPEPATPDDMRQPVQPRAQATIDRICAAAAAILDEGGWDAFNTNVVAARAGVSGPTVYRYFPNKYVLAAELRRRLDEAESQAASPAIARIGDRGSPRAAVEAWVSSTADTRAGRPAAILLRSVSATVPDLSQADTGPDDTLAALTTALQRRQPALTHDSAADRSRVIRTSVDSMIDDAIRDGRPDGRQIGLIVDMAVTMVESASVAPSSALTGPPE